MKTIFDHIDNVVTNKRDYTLSTGESFPPYLIQRWVSMISPTICNFINETSNSQYMALSDDEQYFHDYMVAVIPKIRKSRIKYIKKPKSESDEDLKREATYLKMSVSELKEILEFDPDFISRDNDLEIRKKKK